MRNAPLSFFRSDGVLVTALRHWDWPTLGLFGGCFALWIGALLQPFGSDALSFAMLIIAMVLHASLSHECLHGHPFRSPGAGTALAIVTPGLAVPYLRFRDLHLAHHHNAILTDPYDDPETNYLDPDVWRGLPRWRQVVLRFNNKLSGRMIVGPVVGQIDFLRGDIARIRAGERSVVWHWIAHLPGVALVLCAVQLSPVPVSLYLVACYAALSVLRIRGFLEHQAHARASGRSVIIEDRGPMAFLFLNNNLHVVHHMHPKVSWYMLPALYRAHRDRYVRRNHGYVFRSYAQIFRLYFWRSKDPVSHPLWQARGE